MGENLVLAILALVPGLSAGLLLLLFRQVRLRRLQAGWKSVALGNALLLLFLLGGMALAGECYYRFVYDSTDALMFTRISRRCCAWSRTSRTGLNREAHAAARSPSVQR